MSDMTFTPKQAIYGVQGSIAALVNEEVWEKLLKGEVIGVIENDPYRFSLFINGTFVKSFKAGTEQRLNIKAEKAAREYVALRNADLAKEQMLLAAGQRIKFQISSIEVVPGYPNFISLSPERVKLYSERGFTAERCAQSVRDMLQKSVGKLDSYMGVFTFMDEIDRGMTREGRD